MNAYTFATPFEKSAALALTPVTASSAVFFRHFTARFLFNHLGSAAMGLLSFIKEAGEKLLGHADAQAAEDPNAANQTAADAIKNYIGTQGLDTSNLTVAFDGASRTVTLSGSVADLDTKAKVKVAAGNVQGVAGVNDDDLEPDDQEVQYHDVKPGDTLSAIAKEVYGDANKYPAIFEANKPMLSSPDRIYPGQKLVIPPQS